VQGEQAETEAPARAKTTKGAGDSPAPMETPLPRRSLRPRSTPPAQLSPERLMRPRTSPPVSPALSAKASPKSKPASGAVLKKRPAAAPVARPAKLATKRKRSASVPVAGGEAQRRRLSQKVRPAALMLQASARDAEAVAPDALAVQPLQRSPGGSTSKDALCGLAISEVPLSAFGSGDAVAKEAAGRPRRTRFRPLEGWRNERVVYERQQGSKMPSIASVALNFAPRPTNVSARQLDCNSIQVPPQMLQESGTTQPGGVTEFVGLSTPVLMSKVFALPGHQEGRKPQTVALQPARGGFLRVIEGKVRCGREGARAQDEFDMEKGDSAALTPHKADVLVAAAGAEGARILWVQVRAKVPGRVEAALPVAGAAAAPEPTAVPEPAAAPEPAAVEVAAAEATEPLPAASGTA